MASTFTVKLHGVSFANADGNSRQDLIGRLKVGQQVALRAEPANPHDRHAVGVFSDQGQIGYLPSDARDASAILRGEAVSARVVRVYGGPRFWHKLFGLKRNYGVTIELTKGEPDWKAFSANRNKVEPSEKLIAEGLAAEKAGRTADAMALYKALEEMVEMNRSDPQAAAHRYTAVPINRLTLLLQREGQILAAIKAIDLWRSASDPIGLTKADADAIQKRELKLRKARP